MSENEAGEVTIEQARDAWKVRAEAAEEARDFWRERALSAEGSLQEMVARIGEANRKADDLRVQALQLERELRKRRP